MINSPIFEEKGEINLGAALGSNAELNVSYNPIDNFAIIGNLSTTLGYTVQDSLTNQNNQRIGDFDYRDYQLELGLGTYWRYGDVFYHDFYLGSGIGSSLSYEFADNDPGIEAYEGKHNHWFIQSSLTYLEEDDFSISFDARLNYIEYNTINYAYEGFRSGANFQNDIATYFRDRDRLMLQVGGTMKVFTKYADIFAQGQLGLIRVSPNDFYSARPLSVFFGVSLKVDQLIDLVRNGNPKQLID